MGQKSLKKFCARYWFLAQTIGSSRFFESDIDLKTRDFFGSRESGFVLFARASGFAGTEKYGLFTGLCADASRKSRELSGRILLKQRSSATKPTKFARPCAAWGLPMSWRVANISAEREFGSARPTQISMFLAATESDDGSGIQCSKGMIQRHIELRETTIKRTIGGFLREGVLLETGARGCKNGFIIVYRSDLARIAALELTAEPDIETGATVESVQTGAETLI
ncbi:hypothetical protein [Yoonia sp. SS1-5]|uniref:Uncharacterized protein n=1 Tax=Yoonia rhodophyticola TaxID=3137370 RepID=A0AAN0MD45_9RHOB